LRQFYRNHRRLDMTREVTGCTTRTLFSSDIYGNCQNKQAGA
jgi:hypothetical protein